MSTWKLSLNLTDSEDPNWERLALLSFPDGVHPNRKKGFFLSRQALKDCFLEAGFDIPIFDLHLESYSSLPTQKDITLSLSHCDGCGGALIANKNDFISVGIDVESKYRIVKDAIAERIGHPGDTTLRNIELWCLKEAAFKAIMNSGQVQHPIEFSSITIPSHHEWYHEGSGLKGSLEIDVLTSWVVARAYLRKSSLFFTL